MDTSFQLYQKYTYEDVCRLLDWYKGEVALNIGGYKFDKKLKPIQYLLTIINLKILAIL